MTEMMDLLEKLARPLWRGRGVIAVDRATVFHDSGPATGRIRVVRRTRHGDHLITIYNVSADGRVTRGRLPAAGAR